MKYVDFAQGGAFNRNNPSPVDFVKDTDLALSKDCYATYFQFGEDFKDYVLTNKTVKGYKGIYTADYLPFDIDNEDLSKAQRHAIQLIERLQMGYQLYNADIDIYFTGAKGFHIQIPQEVFGGFNPSEDLARVFKELALEISAGIETDMVIYEPMRLWRLPNTINGKSGLYKIQLSIEELFKLTIEQIKELAKQPRELKDLDPSLSDELASLYSTIVNIKPKKQEIQYKNVYPANEKYCIYQMLNEGVPQGERNNSLLRIAVYLNQKFPQDMVNSIIKTWNTRHSFNLDDNEIETTVESSQNGYEFGCNDGLLKKYCSNKCNYYRRKKSDSQDIKTIDDLEKEYIDYIKDIDNVKIDLKGWLPKFEQVTRGLTAGEVVVLIAGSGVGKTAILQNLLWSTKCPSVFFSYELPEILTYERFYQIVNNCTGENVESDYINQQIDSIAIKEDFKELYFNFNSDTNIDSIPDMVELLEQKINKKIRIVAIDYLGLVKGGFGSRYERVSYISEKLKDIAKKTNSVVICLAQVSRNEGAMGDAEVDLTAGKDSGSIENTGDIVLGAWRPEKQEENAEDKIIKIKILKNRKGQDGVIIKCLFDKKTLRITEAPIDSYEEKVKHKFNAKET